MRGRTQRYGLAAVLLGSLLPLAARADTVCRPVPLLVTGIDARGYPDPRWIAAIRDRIDAGELAKVATTSRPLTPEEIRWRTAIGAEARGWCGHIPELDAAFPMIRPPCVVTILLGNQGGDDGFTSGSDAVALDLAALVRVYGDADLPANRQLIRRLLSHEYTHLLLHPYLDSIGWSEQWAARDPFLRALRVLFNEGIANLRSIEDPAWIDAAGHPTNRAREALAVLEPRMLERLQALGAHPSPEAAARLLRNISQGELDQKWGGLPIALWLASETGLDPARLASQVAAGPDHILELALRNADPRYRPAFRALLDQVPTHVAANR